eukprot:4103928-Prymnesium_polylepis.1
MASLSMDGSATMASAQQPVDGDAAHAGAPPGAGPAGSALPADASEAGGLADRLAFLQKLAAGGAIHPCIQLDASTRVFATHQVSCAAAGRAAALTAPGLAVCSAWCSHCATTTAAARRRIECAPSVGRASATTAAAAGCSAANRATVDRATIGRAATAKKPTAPPPPQPPPQRQQPPSPPPPPSRQPASFADAAARGVHSPPPPPFERPPARYMGTVGCRVWRDRRGIEHDKVQAISNGGSTIDVRPWWGSLDSKVKGAPLFRNLRQGDTLTMQSARHHLDVRVTGPPVKLNSLTDVYRGGGVLPLDWYVTAGEWPTEEAFERCFRDAFGCTIDGPFVAIPVAPTSALRRVAPRARDRSDASARHSDARARPRMEYRWAGGLLSPPYTTLAR